MPLLMAIGVLVSCASAVAADASGKWTWSFSRAGEDYEMTLDLKQEGDKLTGTLHLPFRDGFELDIKDGKVEDDKLSFKTVMERGERAFESKYEGTIEGDTIKGTIERQRRGQPIKREWEAKRKKS
ncbi:MAG: hypothetical protein DWQ37_17420 [Planctomycetota bacterium]|nr:MAG: hypothetical protein DWQ37_17420 [Planctomycetota bacterium]